MKPTHDIHGLNPRQKKFADLFLKGKITASMAYVQAGYAPAAAAESASRLLASDRVQAYIRNERRALSEAARWEKWQLLDYYQRVLETTVGEVDEDHPLAQEVTIDEIGEEVTRKKVKMVGKMDAAKELARMLGWNAPTEVTGTVDVEITIGGDAE